MSESATSHNNAKRSRKASNDIGSGFAATGGSATLNKSAGNTKKVPAIMSPLQAALVSQKLGLESLPKASLPFLSSLMEKSLRDFATHFYAEESYEGMKSTENYVSPSAKKLNLELPNADGPGSEVFTTLRDELHRRLEEFRVDISREIIIPSTELQVRSKRDRYYHTICQVLRLLARTFLSLGNIDTNDYPEELAVIDLFVMRKDDMNVGISLFIMLTTFRKLIGHDLPYPSVDSSVVSTMVNRINGKEKSPTTPSTTPPNSNQPSTALTLLEDADMEFTNDEVAPTVADKFTAGRIYVCDHIFEAYKHCILIPKQDFYDQLKENNETRRIKQAMAPVVMTDTAQQVASVLGKENPAPQPVLLGLIESTTDKTMAKYESRIKSLEDKLAASTSKKAGGGGTKLKGILRKGSPIAAKSNAQVKTTTNKRSSKSKSKKSSQESVPRNQGANNNDTVNGRGKKKNSERKVSFAGKGVNSRINSRK